MSDSTLTVSGLGGGINFEMYIIQKAFEAIGAEVEVINDSQDWMGGMTEKWKDEVVGRKDKYPIKVKLIANHIPWGG